MSEFQSRVLELVLRVPRGRVTTYKELARALGRPRAYRAVANALTKNPCPIKIPCHRVVRADEKIGGYKLGARRKVELLAAEGVQVKDGRIALSKYKFQL